MQDVSQLTSRELMNEVIKRINVDENIKDEKVSAYSYDVAQNEMHVILERGVIFTYSLTDDVVY